MFPACFKMYSCVCVFVVLLIFMKPTAAGARHLKTLEEFQNFFRSTFIQKESGIILFLDSFKKSIPSPKILGYLPDLMNSKRKPQFAPGFNPSWNIYRFHHVCISGGADGIYAGFQGIPQQVVQSFHRLREYVHYASLFSFSHYVHP